MTLKDQVAEFVKFDAALLGPHLNAEEAPYDGTASYWAASGARFEHSRLAPLLEILPEIVEALEWYSCYTSEKRTANELIAKIKEAVG